MYADDRLTPFSYEETLKWAGLCEAYPNHPLTRTLEKLLILPLYHHGLLHRLHCNQKLFEKTLQEASDTFLFNNTTDFSFSWSEEDSELGMKLLYYVSKHHPFFLLVCPDLLLWAQKSKNTDLLFRICEETHGASLLFLPSFVHLKKIDLPTLEFICKNILEYKNLNTDLFLPCITALFNLKSVKGYVLANTMLEEFWEDDAIVSAIDSLDHDLQASARARFLKQFPLTKLGMHFFKRSLTTCLDYSESQ